jgi:hypothetical protein
MTLTAKTYEGSMTATSNLARRSLFRFVQYDAIPALGVVSGLWRDL